MESNSQNILPDVKKAIYFINSAWTSINKQIIINCWTHVNIVKSDTENRVEYEDDSTIRLTHALSSYACISNNETMDPNSYINLDNFESTSPDLTDEDIYNIVRTVPNEDEIEDDIEDIPEVEEKKITIKEVLSSYETIFNFVECSSIFNNELLDNLFFLKSKLDHIAELSKRQSNLDNLFKKA